MKKAVKEAAERAVKQTSRAGLKQFAKKAGREGLEEMGEEVGVDLATQVYQNTTGRRDGLDVRSLGMSAVGGFAGGAGASLAGLGRHATSRGGRFGEGLVREVGGEVLGETAASLATGNGMPDLDEAARAATSGARSGLTSQSTHLLNTGRLDALSGTAGNLSVPPTLPVLPTSDGGPTGPGPGPTGPGVRPVPARPRPAAVRPVVDRSTVVRRRRPAAARPSVAVRPSAAARRWRPSVRPSRRTRPRCRCRPAPSRTRPPRRPRSTSPAAV